MEGPVGFESPIEVPHGDEERSNLQDCSISIKNRTRKELLGVVVAPPSALHCQVQFFGREPIEAFLEKQNADSSRFRSDCSEQAPQHADIISEVCMVDDKSPCLPAWLGLWTVDVR